ncbi:UPF0157-domain-containing protein [Trematosphaeria pertusa]|uniref:UPF0157-domain-containing protein n=1 Tax=Trematosphaeria pertusa TaxID=390896 RepID=A0A6A6II69_9PLEO|nr:UPF0157-domain-containing protein [Trematosphaeria pertusa]KAF2250056.1 UPF0157-domain-containing protein [Trematosphaeria pertusa]
MSVIVEPYNPEWPTQFETIKAVLRSHLADVSVQSIEHVGSTSVPGLAAKPIIDVDIIVARETVQSAINTLVSSGFTYLGELGIADRHALKDPNQLPKRNIYICVDGAFQTRNHLAVRDTLRANPKLRDEYAAVKLQLAAQGTNIVDYVEAKSEILRKILEAAGVLTADELAAIEKANKKGERFGAIKTERLLLREFVSADEEPFFELESKEEVARYQMWPPRTRQQAREEVAKIIRNSAATPRTHVELAVERGGSFIGRVGANVKREVDPPHADLWFSFLPQYQGQGFATEAMKKLTELLGSPMELEIECDPRNEGSWKLANRLEFEKVSLRERAFECKGEWVGSLVLRKIV